MSAPSLVFARAYQQSFDSHPYSTLAFTNGALNAVGDFVAQTAQILVRSFAHSKEIQEGGLSCRLCCVRRILRMTIDKLDMILLGLFGSFVLALEWVRLLALWDVLIAERHIGPLIGRWNTFLEHRFPLRLGHISTHSKVSLSSLTKRVSCDQLIM